ncbi:hypothetical protein VTJ49DRAFT_3771 [Mycothermus thermophilus]|uniref:Uncharacterized protein n=1 Tax=Humicola insolens TaxID=85995 RepID=A0ABR3V7Q7_HUMIN
MLSTGRTGSRTRSDGLAASQSASFGSAYTPQGNQPRLSATQTPRHTNQSANQGNQGGLLSRIINRNPTPKPKEYKLTLKCAHEDCIHSPNGCWLFKDQNPNINHMYAYKDENYRGGIIKPWVVTLNVCGVWRETTRWNAEVVLQRYIRETRGGVPMNAEAFLRELEALGEGVLVKSEGQGLEWPRTGRVYQRQQQSLPLPAPQPAPRVATPQRNNSAPARMEHSGWATGGTQVSRPAVPGGAGGGGGAGDGGGGLRRGGVGGGYNGRRPQPVRGYSAGAGGYGQ